MDLYQQFIHLSRYARYIDELGRRETWEETVERYISFFDEKTGRKFSDVLYDDLKPAIIKQEIMPSMRALMSAGAALDKDNLAGFNCSYLEVKSLKSMADTLYILACGTGVGFSCEERVVSQLPPIKHRRYNTVKVNVADSRMGWAQAFNKILHLLWDGYDVDVDYSRIRPEGERLKTFGGRASGPEPYKRLIEFVEDIVSSRRGGKLNSIEVHDIMCMIGDVIVSGGVRRSALISLSDLNDSNMATAKSGEWWTDHAFRALANNSVAYEERPTREQFDKEFDALIASGSGERGIFNRAAARRQAAKAGRDRNRMYGCNPCSEIILRDKQLCNLTEVVVREDDTYSSLLRKVQLATILGTFQASLTDFKFVEREWIKNTKEEALLGVSMTGIMDCKLTSTNDGKLPEILKTLRNQSVAVNRHWADKLGVNRSASITCVKPSGTVSQLVDSASGIHARYADKYIRTVRMNKTDPLYKFMEEKGFVCEDALYTEGRTAVISFPKRAPTGSVKSSDQTAIEGLELWLTYQRYWCEHKPSVTINVREHEWPEVREWVWLHFDEISGVSFLPFDDHTYEQAPYQQVHDETGFELMELAYQSIYDELDWTEFKEETDNTESAQTLACTAGGCEI